jgi:hypothetical protein
MKFSNFLLPGRETERDGIVIDETLGWARLSDELEVDVIWLPEHHFDGICACVDPITFAPAIRLPSARYFAKSSIDLSPRRSAKSSRTAITQVLFAGAG